MHAVTRLIFAADGSPNLVVLVPAVVVFFVVLGGAFAVIRSRFGPPDEVHARDWAHGAYSIWTGGEDCGDWAHTRARDALRSWYGVSGAQGFWDTIRGLQHGARDSAAWDQVRAIDLLRIGTAAGYLSEDECWEQVTAMAGALNDRFDSWEALAAEFEAGMHRWQGGRGISDPQQRDRVQRNLPYLRRDAWRDVAFKAPVSY